MIILIGGSSHTGKTLLAQKLLEKYSYPYISLDHLKMGFIRTGRTDLTINDDLEMRYFLWPYAAEIIKTAIENSQNLIVEGCYIPKEWRNSFTEEHLREIHCIFITMSEEYIRSRFDDIKEYADIIEKRIDDKPDMLRLIRCSENFRHDCLEFNIPCLDIDRDYDIDRIMAEAELLLGTGQDAR